MERKDILMEPSYWLADVQIKLFRLADKFMEDHGMNRKRLAAHLGVSPGYVTQLLNGDFDHKLSSVAELSLALGYAPKIDFVPVDEMLTIDCARGTSISWRRDASFSQANPTLTKAA